MSFASGGARRNGRSDGGKFVTSMLSPHRGAGDAQSLSHQLHSSMLEYLGAAADIRGFCHEFSRQNEVSVEFTEIISLDICTKVFRCACFE
jgi:hypothetical protein